MVLLLDGVVVDALSYEGSVPGAVETVGAGADTGANPFEGLSRYPDGADTDDNSVDFTVRCATPGEANAPDGAACGDPIPVEPSTWGRVKATYR